MERHEYNRAAIRRFFAGFTPDSRPCKPGQCPLMAAIPSLTRPGQATTLDPPLVHALDTETGRLGYGRQWNYLTAADILRVIDRVQE